MPADRLAMRQIKDLLRLRHDAGLSLREIGRSLNLFVGVVSKYVKNFRGFPLVTLLGVA